MSSLAEAVGSRRSPPPPPPRPWDPAWLSEQRADPAAAQRSGPSTVLLTRPAVPGDPGGSTRLVVQKGTLHAAACPRQASKAPRLATRPATSPLQGPFCVQTPAAPTDQGGAPLPRHSIPGQPAGTTQQATNAQQQEQATVAWQALRSTGRGWQVCEPQSGVCLLGEEGPEPPPHTRVPLPGTCNNRPSHVLGGTAVQAPQEA